MIKKLLFFLILLGAFNIGKSQVIFFEDFDGVSNGIANGGMPADWTLFNVDGRTPDASVAIISNAWVRLENQAGDTLAASTSYYAPAGTANDYMITPAIPSLPANTVLSWDALAFDGSFPDGYQVRIFTTAPTSGNLTSSAVLLTVAAENATLTHHTLNIPATYNGQTVYIAFRNNSNDQYVLGVDNVKLEVAANLNANLVSTTPASEYTIMPVTQLSPITLEGVVQNDGVQALSNVKLNVNVYDGSFSNIASFSSTPVASIAAGASQTITLSPYTLPAGVVDQYYFEYIVTHSAVDGVPSNDTAYQAITVDDSTYARDNGNVVGGLGIGDTVDGFLGQEFTVTNPDRISSVGVYVTTGISGEKMALAIWDMQGGVPSQILFTTDTITYPDDSARYYVLPIHGGHRALAPGNYVVTMIEFANHQVAVGTTNDVFTTGTTWINWANNPLGGWANSEAFGANFAKTFVIRPNLNSQCPALTPTFTSTQPTCTSASGSVTLGALPAGNYTYTWSNAATTANLTNVAAGTYTLTVSDAAACSATASVTLTANTVAVTSTTSTTQSQCVTNDGSATVTPTNGTSPYTYLWSNSGNTQTISNVGAGQYTVVITDANGCSGTASASVTTPNGPSASAAATNVACFGAATGSADLTVTGGTAPITFSWSNSATTEDLTNVTAGTYTVTVNDANSCSFVTTAVVTQPASAITTSVSTTNATCSGSTNGAVDLTATGGTGTLVFAWNNSANTEDISNVSAGTYTVTVTDANSCSTTVSATITAPSSISLSATATDVTSGNNGALDLTATGGTAPYTYAWTNSASTEDLTGLTAGTYGVTVTDANGCSSSASYAVINVGIANIENVKTFNVFPNPSNGLVNVQVEMTNASNLNLQVIDITGKVVYTDNIGNTTNHNFVINTSTLLPAVYFVRINGSNFNATQRLTVIK